MSVSRRATVQGIVIGRASSGEGSIRVFLYTETFGLLSPLAKSAREERSKLRSHFQTGTFGTFSLVKGRDVWRVTGATATENIYFSLGEKRAAALAAARVLSSLRQFVHGETPDPRLFSALFGFLSSVALIEESDIPAAESLIVLRILSALGYVEENSRLTEFLAPVYESALLASAKKERPLLIRTINNAISASGL